MDKENVAIICFTVFGCIGVVMFFTMIMLGAAGDRQLQLERIKLAQMQYSVGYASKEISLGE